MLEQTISATTEPAEQENEVNHNVEQEKQEQAEHARIRKYDKKLHIVSTVRKSSASSGETNIRAHSVIYSSRGYCQNCRTRKWNISKKCKRETTKSLTNFESKRVLEQKHNIENEINRLLREENDAAMLRDIQKVAEETQLAEAVRKKDDVKRRRIIAQATVINRHLEAWLVEEMESIKKRRAALLKRLNENQQELEKLQDSAEIETKILEIKHKEDIWRSQEALADKSSRY